MRILALASAFLIACGGNSPAQERITHGGGMLRPPAVAGRFYPGDSAGLATMVDSLIGTSHIQNSSEDIIAGVVPHAGYVFSGATAADFYSSIEGVDYDVVVIIGPSHRVSFGGFSVFEGNGYLTPLGEVAVATDVAERLRESHPSASFIPRAHESEHCLEVQLPFLQRVLQPGFRIVPIVIGNTGPDELKYMAELMLAEAYDQRILVIASSDLSHYPPMELAEEVDLRTAEAILHGDMDNFLETTSADLLPRELDTFACGRLPIALVMSYSALYPDVTVKLLSMTTSAEFSGDDSQVVGYTSIAFATPAFEPSAWSISREGMDILLEIAASSVRCAVEGKDYSLPERLPAELEVSRGAFVTLRSNGRLRGCIGSMRPVSPLAETVMYMARSAALEDPRFIPVTEAELQELEYEISVLTPLQILDDWRDVVVGTDGLIISGAGGRSGVLLPQVPVEQGWNRVEFLEGVCLKAGLDRNAYLGDVTLYRFQAQVFGEDENTFQE
ncbi:MAG: AmmeMemoRadiSam system protein B [Candidatus Aegiribacteria sp.]|nr:AmmeMemoRadiSam system protein B [Candidatus Aegiribacteria sp.]